MDASLARQPPIEKHPTDGADADVCAPCVQGDSPGLPDGVPDGI